MKVCCTFPFFQNVCYNIEIFGTHLKFFLENEPALYGFTGAKTGITFCFLFLLEHVVGITGYEYLHNYNYCLTR